LPPILISFSGIDGAGKSTQIEKLHDYFSQHRLAVRVLTFWDDVAVFSSLRSGFSRKVLESDGRVGTPEKPAQRSDKNRTTWPLLVGRSLLNLLDVARLRKIVRQTRHAESGGVVIFDRYIYDQLAALPLGHPLARTYARFVLRLAPQPDVCYLLDAIPEEARARKPEYPIEFMRQYRDSYLELRQMVPLSLISAADPEAMHRAIIGYLQKFVSESPLPEIDNAIMA
jgi:thymidylate kinase